MATRHLIRTVVLQTLYEWDFYNQKVSIKEAFERNLKEFAPDIDEPDFAWKILNGVVSHIKEIDEIIKKAAIGWPIERVDLIDRNILRIGLYELLYADKNEVPPKVAINESVEMAKNFGGMNSSKFINGILGSVYKEIENLSENSENKEKKSEA